MLLFHVVELYLFCKAPLICYLAGNGAIQMTTLLLLLLYYFLTNEKKGIDPLEIYVGCFLFKQSKNNAVLEPRTGILENL